MYLCDESKYKGKVVYKGSTEKILQKLTDVPQDTINYVYGRRHKEHKQRNYECLSKCLSCFSVYIKTFIPDCLKSSYDF